METEESWGYKQEEVANVAEKPSNKTDLAKSKLMNDIHRLVSVEQWEWRPDCSG